MYPSYCHPSRSVANNVAVPCAVVRIGWCPSSTAAWVSASAWGSVSGHSPANVAGFGPITTGAGDGSLPSDSTEALATTRATTIAAPAPAVRTRRPRAFRSVGGAEPSTSTGISVARSCKRLRSRVSITRPPLRARGALGATVRSRARRST